MKLWVALATWLSCNIAIGWCINYPTVTFTTHLASVGSYQNFMSALRTSLQSRETSHGIPVLRKPSEITNQNKFIQVQLINYDSQLSITLAVYALDAYVIGYKTGGRSFFLKDAPADSESLLFDGTQKKRLDVGTNYNNLPNRDSIPLGIGPLKSSINTFYNFDGINVNDDFKRSLVILAQMVAEAARFKFIQQYIEYNLIYGYTPKGDTITYVNQWRTLSEQIQLSGPNGVFPTQVQVQNADYSIKYIRNVAEVKPDIAILLYQGNGGSLGDENVGDSSTEDLLQVLDE